MQALLSKTIDKTEDHILKYTIIYMNLKKIPDEKFDKVKSDENM